MRIHIDTSHWVDGDDDDDYDDSIIQAAVQFWSETDFVPIGPRLDLCPDMDLGNRNSVSHLMVCLPEAPTLAK